MALQTNRFSGVIILFISLALAFGLSGLFYYFKIKQNEDYQNQLHLRELKNVSTSLDNSIKQMLNASKTIAFEESNTRMQDVAQLESFQQQLNEFMLSLNEMTPLGEVLDNKLKEKSEKSVEEWRTAREAELVILNNKIKQSNLETNMQTTNTNVINTVQSINELFNIDSGSLDKIDATVDNLFVKNDDSYKQLVELCNSTKYCDWFIDSRKGIFHPNNYFYCILSNTKFEKGILPRQVTNLVSKKNCILPLDIDVAANEFPAKMQSNIEETFERQFINLKNSYNKQFSPINEYIAKAPFFLTTAENVYSNLTTANSSTTTHTGIMHGQLGLICEDHNVSFSQGLCKELRNISARTTDAELNNNSEMLLSVATLLDSEIERIKQQHITYKNVKALFNTFIREIETEKEKYKKLLKQDLSGLEKLGGLIKTRTNYLQDKSNLQKKLDEQIASLSRELKDDDPRDLKGELSKRAKLRQLLDELNTTDKSVKYVGAWAQTFVDDILTKNTDRTVPETINLVFLTSLHKQFEKKFNAFKPCIQNWNINKDESDCSFKLKQLTEKINEQISNIEEHNQKINEDEQSIIRRIRDFSFSLRNGKEIFIQTAVLDGVENGKITIFNKLPESTSDTTAVTLFKTSQETENKLKYIQVPFEDMLGGDTKLHPLILLLDQNGNVLINKYNEMLDAAPSGLNFEHLSSILKTISEKQSAAGKSAKVKIEQTLTYKISKKEDEDDSNTNSAPEDMPGYSGILDIDIAGVEYRLFVTPFSHDSLEFNSSENTASRFNRNEGLEQHFYLIGFKNKELLTSEKLSISRSQITVAMLAFIILLTLIPILKVRFISINQSITKTHQITIWYALILMMALIGSAVSMWVNYNAEKSFINQTSKQIYQQIQNRFKDEITSITKMVQSEQERLIAMQGISDRGSSNDALLYDVDTSNNNSPYWLENLISMPFSEQESENGILMSNHSALWSSERFFRNGNPINIGDREYYKYAKNCSLWPVKNELALNSNNRCTGLFAQRLFNLRDSRLTTQFSASKPLKNGTRHLVSFGAKLRTFMYPVLPANYGFLVFDNKTGIVQYHSDESRSLVESIFVETDNDPALKQLINNPHSFDSPVDLRVTYRGKKYLFVVNKLADGIPWTLVVFYNKEEHRTLLLLKALNSIVILILGSLLVLGFGWLILASFKLFFNKSINILKPPSPFNLSFSRLGAAQFALYLFCLIGLPAFFTGLILTTNVGDIFNDKVNTIHQQLNAQRVVDSAKKVQTYKRKVISNLNLQRSKGAMVYSGKLKQEAIGLECNVTQNRQSQKLSSVIASSSMLNDLIEMSLPFATLDGPLVKQLDVSSKIAKQSSTGQLNSKYHLGDNCEISKGYVTDRFQKSNQHPFIAILQLILIAVGIVLLVKTIFYEWIAKRLLGAHVPGHFRENDEPQALGGQNCIQLIRSTQSYINKQVMISDDYQLVSPRPLNLSSFNEDFDLPDASLEKQLKKLSSNDQTMTQNGQIVGYKCAHRIVLEGIENVAFDTRLRNFTLDILEILSKFTNLQIILICEVAPLYRLTNQQSYPRSCRPGDYADTSEIVRWSNLLRKFSKQYVVTARSKKELPDFLTSTKVLQHECDAWPELEVMKGQFWQYHCSHKVDNLNNKMLQLALGDKCPDNVKNTLYGSLNKHWQPDQVIEYFSANAGPFYRYRWELCTRSERLLLIQLASGEQPNPMNFEPLEHLTRRGYIFRHNGWHIVNESLRRFVLTAESPETMSAWLDESKESTWKYMRIPLFALVIALLAIMAYSATDAVESAIGILTAVLGLVPLAIRNMSLFKVFSGS